MRQLFFIGSILLVCAGTLFFVWSYLSGSRMSSVEESAAFTSLVVAEISKYPPREVSAGQKEFRSDLYDLSVLYPDTLNMKITDEGAGAATVVFENNKTAQGFQLFIVPFTEGQITEERFKRDEPSGVRDKLSNIKIDGATGASFFGKNGMIGDTAEVWFIHGGYLYEVTALKVDAQWLSTIMSTWKFL